MSAPSRCLCAAALAVALVGAFAAGARAGAFFFVDDDGEQNWITHPLGYFGTGGPLALSVCIDPTSANASAMQIPVENVVRTMNALEPTTANLVSGLNNNIPFDAIDFESVLLHELGHCLGLAHPNLGSESLLASPFDEFARTTDGADDDHDVGDGPFPLDTGGVGSDGVRASADDLRGDDVNVHWFHTLDNDPFGIATLVDGSTYSRDAANLPGSDSAAVVGSRSVSFLLRGSADTEAVMHQGSEFDEAQRTLGHDDVATLRIGMAGLDETAGTSDDYTLALSYAGRTASCDLVIDFDDNQTGFAGCRAAGTFVGTNHIRQTGPAIFFNTGFHWFFNGVSNAPKPVPALSLLGGLALVSACLGAAWARLR